MTDSVTTSTTTSTTSSQHKLIDANNDTDNDYDNENESGLNLDDYITQKRSPEQTILSKSRQCDPISDEVVEKNSRSLGCSTDSEDLAAVEPGTNILLEGIIWNETTKGVLILNVTWRGKSYCGTLIDSNKSSWAPPSFKDFPKSSKSQVAGGAAANSANPAFYSSNSGAASNNSGSKDPYSYFGNYGPASSLDLNTVQLCTDPTVRTLRNGKRRYINQFENDLISDIELEVCNSANSNTVTAAAAGTSSSSSSSCDYE